MTANEVQLLKEWMLEQFGEVKDELATLGGEVRSHLAMHATQDAVSDAVAAVTPLPAARRCWAFFTRNAFAISIIVAAVIGFSGWALDLFDAHLTISFS